MFVNLTQRWANCNPGAEALHTCCLCLISCCPCRVELSLQRAGNPVVHKAKNIDHLALYRLSLLALGTNGDSSHELTFCASKGYFCSLQGRAVTDLLQSKESLVRLEEMLFGVRSYDLKEQGPSGSYLVKTMKGGGPLWEGPEFLWD